MDVVLSVLRPKAGHASQQYSPQLYEILLLDSKTPQGEKVKPAKYMPMFPTTVLDDEPREVVLTQLFKLTGIKGERALLLNWNQDISGSHRDSLSQFSLFFIPVCTNEKVSKKFLEQAPNSPAFYPLEYVIEAVSSGSVHFPSPTQMFLLHLESWLREKHQKAVTVECLFRPKADFRVHLTVHNPVFIPSLISPNGESSTGGGKKAPFPPKIQLTANEALANMLSIEKCDIVVMNPLFGSGLPYKTKVNRYEINHFWPRVPDYNSITVPTNLPEPRWRDKYPLHSCAAEGDRNEVDVLLKKGYKHSKLDSIMWAPIHYAAWYSNVSVVEALLAAGCSPNLCDGEMNTPLHIAARKGLPSLTQCLLRSPDINVNQRDKEGKRPIDVCLAMSDKSSRHEQVEHLLREGAVREQSLIIEVSLMDNSSKTLQLTSGLKTTVQHLNQQMMKVFNLPKNYTDVFTLWICSKSLELQLKLEHEVVNQLRNWQKRSVNMLTEANPSEEEPYLKWRKNVKVSVEKEKKLQHPKALDLLFHEAYHNYINGLYPCEDKDVINFSTSIFALQHHGASNVKSILSKLSSDKLKELVPAAMLRIKDSSHWMNKISKEYSSVKELNKQQLKSLFLETCRKLPVYGSAFFTGNMVSQQRKSSISHTHCYIGVNAVGIHIISIQSKQMIQSLKYKEITWKHILEKSLLEVKIVKPEHRESRNQRMPATRGVIEIRTRQAGLIDHLMQQLSQTQVKVD